MTPMQAKLQHKIGNVDAKTFTLKFPKNTPNSTHITGKTGDEADMGVHYEVRVWISERPEDKKNAKKTTAAMTVRKVRTVKQSPPPIRSIFNGLPSLSFFFRFSLLMLCICWMVRDC